MIDDRLDPDIAGGHAASLFTILVPTGSTTEKEARDASPAPDVVIADLKTIL